MLYLSTHRLSFFLHTNTICLLTHYLYLNSLYTLYLSHYTLSFLSLHTHTLSISLCTLSFSLHTNTNSISLFERFIQLGKYVKIAINISITGAVNPLPFVFSFCRRCFYDVFDIIQFRISVSESFPISCQLVVMCFDRLYFLFLHCIIYFSDYFAKIVITEFLSDFCLFSVVS